MERTFQTPAKSVRAASFSTRCDEFTLEKGQFYRIRVGKTPLKVTSHGGVVWVTGENDPQDYILQCHQSVSLAAPGLVVIQALQSAKLCITSC